MAFLNLFYLAATLVTKGIPGEQKQKANVLAYGVPDPSDFNTKKPARPLDAAQVRALATGGILFYHSDQPIKGLYPLTTIGKARNRAGLTEWWGISNTEEALETLLWLQEQGHRHTYAARLEQNPDHWQRTIDSQQYVTYTPDLNVAAWDYGRLVNVARWSYDCQYLTWEQAWPFIALGTELAMQEYDSWANFANGFLAGRVLWQPGSETHEYVGEAADKLLKDPDSVWKHYPW